MYRLLLFYIYISVFEGELDFRLNNINFYFLLVIYKSIYLEIISL